MTSRPRPLALLAVLAPVVAVAAVAALVLAPRGSAADPRAPRLDAATVRVEAFTPDADGSGAPALAPERFDRRVLLRGAGFYGTSHGPVVRVELESGELVRSPLVILHDDATIEAALPERARGRCRVTVENPDRRTASLALDL